MTMRVRGAIVRALKSLLRHLVLPWVGVALALVPPVMLMTTGFGGFFIIVFLWLLAWFFFLMGVVMQNISMQTSGSGSGAGPDTGVSS
jgi:hypothetical protein